MPAYSFVPLTFEKELMSRTQLARDQIAQGRNMDLATVARLTGINRAWSWLPPSAQLGFAQAGFHADSNEVKDAAQLELRRRARNDQIHNDLRQINSVDEFEKAKKSGALQGLSHQKIQQLRDRVLANTGVIKDGGNGGLFGTGIDPGYSAGRLLKGDVAGAVAGPGAEQASLGDTPHDITAGGVNLTAPIRGAARQAGVIAAAPLEQAQGFIRGAAQGVESLATGHGLNPQDPSTTPYLQSQLGQELETLSGGHGIEGIVRGQGQPVDLGAGWLPSPDSKIAKAAHDVQLRAGPTIGGHAFSLGRGLAAGLNEIVPGHVLEPDSFGFDLVSGSVDAAVAMKDPSFAVLDSATEARQAGRLLAPSTAADKAYEDAGIFQGARKFVAREGTTPEKWYDSPIGNTVLSKMAEERSPSEIVRKFGMPVTAANGDPLARRAAELTDPQELKDWLRPYLGADVQGPLKMPGGFVYGVRRGLSKSPTLDRTLTGMFPEHFVDPMDKASSWDNLDKYMQAGNIPIERRNLVLDKYLRANGPDESYQAWRAASDAVKEQLRAAGMKDEKRITELGNIFPDAAHQSRLYDLDTAKNGERLRDGVVVAEGGQVLPGPQLTTEALNRMISLPDPRELRRATSKFAKLVDGAPWKVTTGALDSFIGFWRSAHLLRPGLGIRIVGDSQLSLAANGYDSLFTHPLNTISAIVGGNLDKRWAQNMARLPGVNPTLAFDALDAPMIQGYDDVERAIHGGFAAVEDPTKVALAGFHPVHRGHEQYTTGLIEELGRLGGDPRVRGILQQDSPEAAKNWFWSGDGAALRERYIPLSHDINEGNKAKALTLGGNAYHLPLDFESPEGSERFVNDILERVHDTTGGSEELRQAILTRKLGGKEMVSRHGVANQDAADYLKEFTDAGFGPDAVKARDYAVLPSSAKAHDRALKTQVVRSLFDHMVMLPDADLDRIPAYQQAYWKRAAEYLPYLDDSTVKVAGQATTLRDLVLKRAEENMPEPSWFSDRMGGNAQETLTRLRNTPVDAGARKLSLDEFHTLTKSAALDEIPRLVHDLSSRSQFFDMTRLLFPFGDAFRRIAQRWATNAWEHPGILRRAQQGITAARQSGFFHIDPTTGDEVFSYPGSEFITDKLLGVPVPLQGAVSGLSMVGEGLPGVGPVVSIPAKYFMPDIPALNEIHKYIFPFGEQAPAAGGPVDEIAQSVVPPSLDKLGQGLMNDYHDQKRYNTIVGSLMRSLKSTGDYDGPDHAAENQRLLSDAKEKARYFYIIQGLAQTSAPSAPMAQWKVKDKTGRWEQAAVIVNDYRKKQTELGPDGAFNWLLEHHGIDNAFMAQAFSKPIVYGVPVTKEGNDWVDAHQDVKAKYPNTFGYFAPQQGKFDIMSFEKQFVRGERKSLPAGGDPNHEDQLSLAENRWGMWLYHKALDKIYKMNGGDSPDSGQQEWLRKYKVYLEKEHPGFGLVTFDNQKLPRTINELVAASKDKNLQSLDATQGLKDYLHFRDQAIAQAKDDGFVSFGRAGDLVDLRAWLRKAADAVIKHHPDFAPMWEQIFQHEMVSDVGTTEDAQTTNTPQIVATGRGRGFPVAHTVGTGDTRSSLPPGGFGTLPGTDAGTVGRSGDAMKVTPPKSENIPKVSGPRRGLSSAQVQQLNELQAAHPSGDVTVSRQGRRLFFHLPDGTTVPYRQKPVSS